MIGAITRRRFIQTSAALTFARRTLLAQPAAPNTFHIGDQPAARPVPQNFVGLSYENMQLEDPSFFSAENAGLIRQFRAIAPHGILRLGGNTSEFGWWQAAPGQSAPHRVDSPWKAAGEPTSATVFAITPQAIDNLNAFLEATGWTCIYGLNLGYGTPATDVPEARYVAARLGPRLEYFQVGNEVDLFKGHLRDPATWGVDAYLEQWLAIARAVQAAMPGARFGMPDVAGDVSWLPQLAQRWPAVTDKPHVVGLSHHYYWGGPPASPAVNVMNLLKPDPRIARDAQLTTQAAAAFGPATTWRMTEGNTVYRGGKPGVSDVFASALWAADYLLQLATLGYAGVNLHGGSGHAQAVSVGGVFHGEALMPDPTVPHPKPFYTPIANEGTLAGAGVDGKLNGTYVLEPVAHGMQFAAAFAGSTVLPVTFNPGPVNASAYAARTPAGKTLIALINKDSVTPLTVPIDHPCRISLALTAPSLDSHEASLQANPALPCTPGQITIPPHTAWLLTT